VDKGLDKMNECIGIFGKIFGHKFKTYQTHSNPNYMTFTGIDESLEKLINQFKKKDFEIICKRCGDKL